MCTINYILELKHGKFVIFLSSIDKFRIILTKHMTVFKIRQESSYETNAQKMLIWIIMNEIP